jgi:Zn-dependent peptidase ImmA (M78 family)
MTTKLDGLSSVAEIRAAADAAAQETLTWYWPGGHPVDPVKIARDMGVEVYSAQLGNDTWGLLVGQPGSVDIYVDSDQPPNRFRFTVAHELGHYVTRRDEAEVGFVDKRSTEGQGDPNEVFANHFAGALLMPADVLQRLARAGLSDMKTAQVLGVSLDALRYRKALLGL